MGNYKFRLSDMIPNAWFYKLKDMNKTRNSKKQHNTKPPPPSVAPPPNKPKPPLSDQRKSYYFTRDLNPSPNNDLTVYPKTQEENPPEPPTSRKSTRRRRSTKRIRNYSVVSDSSFIDSVVSPDATTSSSDHENGSYLSSSTSSYRRDIIIDMENQNPQPLDAKCDHKIDGFHNLPPIITKRENKPSSLEANVNLNEERKQCVKVSTCAKQHKMATGLKLRTNSPRLAASRRIQARKSVSGLRSVTESFVIVKSSENPERDFRESMVEMIVENDIRTSKDLEELLACYLSLNCDEYHDLIINVFKQIWFDIIDV